MARLYAASVVAQRIIGSQHSVVSKAASVMADNENEATGAAVNWCRTVFLQSEGWFAHQAAVWKVSDDHVTRGYKGMLLEQELLQ